MSSTDLTLRIPKTIGTNNLIETFGKIHLSAEPKEFLAYLGGKIVVSYSAGSTQPEIEILGRNGKPICSIDEFTKLGQYRRWVNDVLKELEKEQASEEKVKLLALFIRRALAEKLPIGDRINEGNETRFRQFNAMVLIVETNLDKIEVTVDSSFKDYLVAKLGNIRLIYYKLMLACVESKPVPPELLEEMLFENGVPKWIHSKAIDKNFTANLRHDAVTLLFPRGNFTKGVALTQRELLSEDFLATNRDILGKSGSIIALARHDYLAFISDIPSSLDKEVKECVLNHMWVLVSPYSTAEILEIRKTGKIAPSFKARQKPNPSGKMRPETESQHIKREIYNILSVVNVTWLQMMNLVIPCGDPKEVFWSHLVDNSHTWNITPSNTIYHNLQSFGTDLEQIKNLSNKALLGLMAEIICQELRIPTGAKPATDFIKVVQRMHNRAAYRPIGTPIGNIDVRLNVDLSVMEQTKLEDEYIKRTKEFLSIKSSITKKKERKSKIGAVRLTTEVLDELELIKDHPIYEKVKTWLATSFKSANRGTLQKLAAERVAGEVLKYQDIILGEEFDEYDYLREMEYGEDDEE